MWCGLGPAPRWPTNVLLDLTARPRWYVLDGHTPRPAASVAAWAQWFSHHAAEAVVAVHRVGEVTIDTRFTGMDHALTEHSPPAVFETFSSDGVVVIAHGSAATWDEAHACHTAAVAAIRRALAPAVVPSTRTPRAKAWAVLRRAWNVGASLFSFSPTKESP